MFSLVQSTHLCDQAMFVLMYYLQLHHSFIMAVFLGQCGKKHASTLNVICSVTYCSESHVPISFYY